MIKASKYHEHTYTKADINKAFSMGLEMAVIILENAISLPPAGQRSLLNNIKEKIIKDKVAAAMGDTPPLNNKVLIDNFNLDTLSQ